MAADDEAKVVRVRGWSLVSTLIAPVGLVILALALAFGLRDQSRPIVLLLVVGGAVIAALLIVVLKLGPRQTYTTVTARHRDLFTDWQVNRSEVTGFRKIIVPRGRDRLELETTSGRARSLPDCAEAREWLAGVPDLDQRDREELAAQIAADSRLGDTAQARTRRARLIMQALAGLAVLEAAVAFASTLHGAPRQLALAALVIPLLPLGLAAWLRARSAPVEAGQDAAAPLSRLVPLGPFFIWCAGAVLLSNFGRHFDHLGRLFAPGLLVGGLLVAAVFALEGVPFIRRRRPGEIIACLVAILAFGFGVMLVADRSLDTAPATRFRAAVEDKSVSHGRRHTSYYLRLAAWGEHADGASETVSSGLWDRMAVGDQLCIEQHPGALGAPWHEDDRCPALGGDFTGAPGR